MANNNNNNNNNTSTSSSSSAADGGYSQNRVNSPRFSGPMTRRAQSFKHHEIDVLNSPRSSSSSQHTEPNAFESLPEKKQQTRLRKRTGNGSGGGGGGSSGNIEFSSVLGGLDKKKQWLFFLFCGFCLFLGIFKVSVYGWFGSAVVEKIGEL